MRKLSDGTNVDPADADYPNGVTRDKDGATPGTIGNKIIYGDIIQLFQKLVIDAGITENDLFDNVSNGYQLLEALINKIEATSGLIKIINIGDWDMFTTLTVSIAHGLTASKIRRVTATILRDDSAFNSVIAEIPIPPLGANDGIIYNSSNVDITREAGGAYASSQYATTSFNRGWIIIDYVS